MELNSLIRKHPMKKKPTLTPRVLTFCLFLGSPAFVAVSHGQTDVDAPVTAKIEANTDINVVAPTTTFFGTRGLSQTSSAEALGEGRLIFDITGSWYQQQHDYAGVPNKNANIFSGIGAVSLGVNRQIDVFASLAGYGSTDYNSDSASGLGSVGGGIQGTLPLPQDEPIRLAAQLAIYQGLSNNAVDRNYADGYDYFETRTGLDFMAKLIQTLTLGHESTGFKLHANEGLVTSSESNTEALLQLAAGAQVNLFATILGLEIHSRTPFSNIDMVRDPLWLTPSLQFRTPYDINLTLGGDVALSQTRNDATGTRALEPYRLFAGMGFTFDTEYGKRAAAKAKAQREAMEQGQLQSNNRELANNLANKTRDDSLARMRQQAESDSMTGAAAAKASQDSLAMANKASQDSSAMAAKARQDSLALVEEQSKRSDEEKRLLSTGLLLLDNVYFNTGKSDISINSEPYLNIIAKMLAKYPKLQIEVAGYTDNVGAADYNLGLSQERAQAVAAYMIGVAPSLQGMLTTKGYGMSQPKASNSTADGRKRNRRTELHVLNKDALSEYNP